MHTQIDSLIKREMTRKEFLMTVGFGVASVMGLGSILKFVKPSAFGPITNRHNVSRGYGSSSYGN